MSTQAERVRSWFADHRGQVVRRPHGRTGYRPVRLDRPRPHDVVPWGPVVVARRVGDDHELRLYPTDVLTMIPGTVTDVCITVVV